MFYYRAVKGMDDTIAILHMGPATWNCPLQLISTNGLPAESQLVASKNWGFPFQKLWVYPPPPFRQLFLVSFEYSIIQADDMLPLVMLEKLQRNTSNEEHKDYY